MAQGCQSGPGWPPLTNCCPGCSAPYRQFFGLMGGTIASTIDGHGNSVLRDLQDYVKEFHELDGKVTLDVISFSRLGGFETRIEDVAKLTEELNCAVREDELDGIVVVMGTNVMEEMAFAIHILVQTQMTM